MVERILGWYDRKRRRVRDLSCGDTRVYLEFEVRRVLCRRCGEGEAGAARLPGRQPASTPSASPSMSAGAVAVPVIKDVAEELRLDWHTVKALEKQYMRRPARRRPAHPAPRPSASTRSRSARATPTGSW
ncbi:MAG: transposase family protein [Comamonadaceae bacterium]|nr:transposase family protein [Comamonadaceae bacterium]